MKPIEFEGSNTVFAKDQKEYQPLPAQIFHNTAAPVITCWQLTAEEIEVINKTGKLYISQLRFGKFEQEERDEQGKVTHYGGDFIPSPLQPIYPSVDLDEVRAPFINTKPSDNEQ